MIIISHRINTIEDLRKTPRHLGVEVDIRSHLEKLITVHDPFSPGENFQDWLKYFDHAFAIFNIKEEGIESYLLKEVEKKGLTSFFLLDLSFPFLIKWIHQGERRVAIRVSCYESHLTALSLRGRADWCWIDCFNKKLIPDKNLIELKEARFKLCFVSPELHGYPEDDIKPFIDELKKLNIEPDAVCTKHKDVWETF